MAHQSVSVSIDEDASDLAARICRLLQVTARYLGVDPLPQPPVPARLELEA